MMERTCSKNGDLAMTVSLQRFLLLVAVFFQRGFNFEVQR